MNERDENLKKMFASAFLEGVEFGKKYPPQEKLSLFWQAGYEAGVKAEKENQIKEAA